MVVKVYMSCCGGDKVLDAVNEAIRLSGIEAQVEMVKELSEIAKAGVMSTPAIKVNNRLIASGRIPKLQDLVILLTNAAAKES
jgi:alkyl hydroperoxide reductase subunit AhpF